MASMAESMKAIRNNGQDADRCTLADRYQGQQDCRLDSASLWLASNACFKDYDQVITFFANFPTAAEVSYRQHHGSARLRRFIPSTEIP